MNTPLNIQEKQAAVARYVVARLQAGAQTAPHHVSERLRAARERALAARKRELTPQRAEAVHVMGNGTAALGYGPGDSELNWRQRFAAALPIIALAAGLMLISSLHNEDRAREVAEVDAALLTDDLPPAAYADPGFVQFLKISAERGTQ